MHSYTTNTEVASFWKSGYRPTPKPQVHYELGIGKNRPVNSVEDPQVTTKTNQEHAQYWPIHTAELIYPSSSIYMKKKAAQAKIEYILQAQEYLPIIPESSTIHKPEIVDFDLNTPWVELLIHHQLTSTS